MFESEFDSPREEGFDISPRFRQTLEDRVLRLETDADHDEAQIPFLYNRDHIRRQRRLVAAERAEALRLRIFLDNARTRAQEPGIVKRDR